MAQGYFITGTDTDVGKTYVAQCLIKAFREQNYLTAGFKPVASGGRCSEGRLQNEDAELLMQQSNVEMPYELVNPYCFKPAIAPHIAAKKQDCTVSLGVIKSAYQQIAKQSDMVIVEGAGGWCVPLSESLSFNDIPAELGLPVILVVGLKLGCINHALLTQVAILQTGCKFAGWVGNEVKSDFEEKQENINCLKKKLHAPFLGAINFDIENNIANSYKNLDIKQLS